MTHADVDMGDLCRVDPANPEIHAEPPSTLHTWGSFALLLVSLAAVVGLAKVLSSVIERAVVAAGAPKSLIGIAIAMLVLMPETSAAVRAARVDRLQTSMNLAIGSALASIGLTIPVVAGASIVLGNTLVLGLDEPNDIVMLALTFVMSAVPLATGRTHVMQGAVHVVMFAVPDIRSRVLDSSARNVGFDELRKKGERLLPA